MLLKTEMRADRRNGATKVDHGRKIGKSSWYVYRLHLQLVGIATEGHDRGTARFARDQYGDGYRRWRDPCYRIGCLQLHNQQQRFQEVRGGLVVAALTFGGHIQRERNSRGLRALCEDSSVCG